MGLYLTTDIVSPQIKAVGGLLTGNLTFKAPAPGNFYLIMEQYSNALAFIPGSRAFLELPLIVGSPYINSTVDFSVLTPVVAGEQATIPVGLTLPNTDCLLYLFVKEIASVIPAGSFVIGTTYKIVVVGSTDFTLVGAPGNTIGTLFTATGVGAGTGTVCEIPDPDLDNTVDYVVITILSTAPVPAPGGIDIGAIANLMIIMMIMGVMMKMMTGASK